MLNVPKSRVNITYEKYTGGAKERIELPLRMLMLGNYGFKEHDPDEDPLFDRDKIQINQRNFNEVMRKMDLNLDFTVANKLSGEEGDEMNVKLKIDDLKSFRPEAVAQQVGELKTIMQIRDLLLALKSHLVSKRQFRRELEKLVQGDLDAALKQFAELGYLSEEESDEEAEAKPEGE